MALAVVRGGAAPAANLPADGPHSSRGRGSPQGVWTQRSHTTTKAFIPAETVEPDQHVSVGGALESCRRPAPKTGVVLVRGRGHRNARCTAELLLCCKHTVSCCLKIPPSRPPLLLLGWRCCCRGTVVFSLCVCVCASHLYAHRLFIWILFTAAVASAGLQAWPDCGLILGVVVINVGIGVSGFVCMQVLCSVCNLLLSLFEELSPLEAASNLQHPLASISDLQQPPQLPNTPASSQLPPPPLFTPPNNTPSLPPCCTPNSFTQLPPPQLFQEGKAEKVGVWFVCVLPRGWWGIRAVRGCVCAHAAHWCASLWQRATRLVGVLVGSLLYFFFCNGRDNTTGCPPTH